MSQSGDLAFLKLLCTSGIDLISHMPVASECLRRLIPSFSLSMIRVDRTCVPQQHYSEYFDDASHALFAQSGPHFSTRNEDPSAFANLMARKVPYGNLIDHPPGYFEGMVYQHLFKRNGIHHVLDVAVRDASGPLAILGIFRDERSTAFTRSDVATVQALYPSLVHACARKALPADFDEIQCALIVVNRAGVIQWASEQARSWLEAASPTSDRPLLVDQGQLPEACRELCRRYHTNLASQGKHHDSELPELTLAVPGGRLRLRAYGLHALHAGGADPGYIGVQLNLEMHHDLRVLRVLEQSRLTPQQCRIAFAFVRGRSHAEICQDLSLSPATLKSYLKDLYARLEVTSAGDLVKHIEREASCVTFNLRRHLPTSRMAS